MHIICTVLVLLSAVYLVASFPFQGDLFSSEELSSESNGSEASAEDSGLLDYNTDWVGETPLTVADVCNGWICFRQQCSRWMRMWLLC